MSAEQQSPEEKQARTREAIGVFSKEFGIFVDAKTTPELARVMAVTNTEMTGNHEDIILTNQDGVVTVTTKFASIFNSYEKPFTIGVTTEHGKGIVVDANGEISDADTLNHLELICAGLYDQIDSELADSSSTRMGTLVETWGAIEKLAETSPRVQEIYADYKGSVELLKRIRRRRMSGVRTNDPNTSQDPQVRPDLEPRSRVDAQVDQDYIIEHVAEKHGYWQRALDAESENTRLKDENASLLGDNTQLQREAAQAQTDYRHASRYARLFEGVLDGVQPKDAQMVGLDPYQQSRLKEAWERRAVDPTAARDLIDMITGSELITSDDVARGVGLAVQLRLPDAERERIFYILRDRKRRSFEIGEEDEYVSEQEMAPHRRGEKGKEDEGEEDGPLAAALRGFVVDDEGGEADKRHEESEGKPASSEEVGAEDLEVKDEKAEQPEMSLQEIARETRRVIDHLRGGLEQRLKRMQADVDPETVERYERVIDMLRNQRPVAASFSTSQIYALRDAREPTLQELGEIVARTVGAEQRLEPPSVEAITNLIETELPRQLSETIVEDQQTQTSGEVSGLVARARELVSPLREAAWSGEVVSGNMQQIQGFIQELEDGYVRNMRSLLEVLEANTGYRDFRNPKEELPGVLHDVHQVTYRVKEMIGNLSQTMNTVPEIFIQCRVELDRLESELRKLENTGIKETSSEANS